MSEVSAMASCQVTGAPDAAHANRSVWAIAHVAMNPP